jgi:hypothetical protein
MPTATDLVTDLPADFEVFGQAVATSLADLLGGTSGQVLAKNSNTDMDFVWVAQDDSNAIQNTIVDAKGDLIAASAADTPARLAVGNNGESLVCDSSTTTGLRYQASTAAGRNFVINGGQDVWQRGTSVASTGNTYTADRFQTWSIGGAATTTSRQTTSDTTNLPSIQYCARVQRNSGQTITSAIAYQSTIETINSIPLVGKTIVISFYARAGSNFSATSNALTFLVAYGTGTDQNIASFTGSATVVSSTATLTSTWQRFQATATVPTTATELAFQSYYTPTGTASTNDYFEITGIQLELGSVPSTFSRAAGNGNIQGELAACQRYYERLTAAMVYEHFGVAQASNTTTALATVYFKVSKRSAVSATVDFSTLGLYDTAAIQAISALSMSFAGINSATVSCTSSGLTAQRFYQIMANNSTAAYIGFSAEL